VTFLTATGAQ